MKRAHHVLIQVRPLMTFQAHVLRREPEKELCLRSVGVMAQHALPRGNGTVDHPWGGGTLVTAVADLGCWLHDRKTRTGLMAHLASARAHRAVDPGPGRYLRVTTHASLPGDRGLANLRGQLVAGPAPALQIAAVIGTRREAWGPVRTGNQGR